MFSAVLGVTDQALASGIDDPVEQFEGDLADKDRKLVASLYTISLKQCGRDLRHLACYGHRSRIRRGQATNSSNSVLRNSPRIETAFVIVN
jgi:hypothetical protein